METENGKLFGRQIMLNRWEHIWNKLDWMDSYLYDYTKELNIEKNQVRYYDNSYHIHLCYTIDVFSQKFVP